MIRCSCVLQSAKTLAKRLCLAIPLVDTQYTMKTYKAESQFGNFQWKAEAEVSEQMADVLAGLGLLWVLQRSPSSAAEKKMAGYEKRPDKFKRNSIPFNAENAELLRKALESAEVEVGRDDKDKAITEKLEIAVSVEEYVPTVADVKMDDERNAYERNAADLKALADKIAYTGDLGSGKRDEAPIPFLRALNTWATAQRKAFLAGM